MHKKCSGRQRADQAVWLWSNYSSFIEVEGIFRDTWSTACKLFCISSVVNTSPTSAVDSANAAHSNEESIDWFTEEVTESDHEREKRFITSELSRFRKEPFSSSQISKQKWLALKRDAFPTVIRLAQHILGIPPSQIDNERIFTSAGRTGTPRPNSITTSQINDLFNISKNYPQAHMVHSISESVGLEEVSDYIVSIEVRESDSPSE